MREARRRQLLKAPSTLVDKLGTLPYQVVGVITGNKRVLLTDVSTLWDFRHGEGERESYRQSVIEWIKEMYGVDVSDVADLNIVRICDRIAAGDRNGG